MGDGSEAQWLKVSVLMRLIVDNMNSILRLSSLISYCMLTQIFVKVKNLSLNLDKIILGQVEA